MIIDSLVGILFLLATLCRPLLLCVRSVKPFLRGPLVGLGIGGGLFPEFSIMFCLAFVTSLGAQERRHPPTLEAHIPLPMDMRYRPFGALGDGPASIDPTGFKSRID